MKPLPQKKSEGYGLRAIFPNIAIICAIACAVYFNTLFNGFVYDDGFQVLKNPWIRDMRFIGDIFSTNVAGFNKYYITNYYRPMMHIILMVDYHLFGLNAWGFHLMNVVFHACISVMIFLIVSALLKKEGVRADYLSVPLMTALVYAVHPVHTEAVAWISGIPDLSFTLFFLLSFYLYIISDFRSSRSNYFYFLSVALFFLSTLCKEPALALPIVLLAYDHAYKTEELRFSDYLKRYLPYLLAAGVYFILRFWAIGGIAPVKRHGGLNTYQNIINVFPLFTQYLGKLLLPLELNAFYVLHPIMSIWEPRSILSICVAIFFIGLAFFTWKKKGIAFVGLMLIVIPLAPALYIPAVGENSFAERYLYLPSFGALLVLLPVLFRLTDGKRKFVIVRTVMLIAVMILFSLATLNRNAVWKDNLTLFTDTVKKSPESAVSQIYLAEALLDKGRSDEAVEHYNLAIVLNPFNITAADAYFGLGYVYFTKGQLDKAIDQYRFAIGLRPDFAEVHNALGDAFLQKGWLDNAIEEYRQALTKNPDYADALKNLEAAYSMKQSEGERGKKSL